MRSMKRVFSSAVLMILFSLFAVREVDAEDRMQAGYASLQFVAEVLGLKAGEDFQMGIRMSMDPHWHSYWINPGDSGLATKISWDMPDGFKADEIIGPYPHRVDYETGLTSYTYDGEILFLSRIHVPVHLKREGSVQIKAEVKWLACEKICVPGKASIQVSLPMAGGEPTPNPEFAKVFKEKELDYPSAESLWTIEAFEELDALRIEILSPKKGEYVLSNIQFFPFRDDLIDHTAKQAATKTEQGYEMIIPKSIVWSPPVDRLSGLLVADEGWSGPGTHRALSVNILLKH